MKKYEEIDLNIIFKGINRFSLAHDEGNYYEIIRRSPSPIVISGGQTGVDSLGLQAASALGLPCYAIMPKGCRREFEDKNSNSIILARTIELQSESYRFRTYANVYYSDITLIWDFCNSEGSKAAEDASVMLNRFYIFVNETGINETVKIINKLQPKVINIAGNRGSILNEEQERAVFSEIYLILKRYCGSLSSLSVFNNPGSKNDKITIGIPNFYQAKDIFKRFIFDYYGLEIKFDKKLFYKIGDFNVILARPRDLIDMLNNSIDVIFVGSDLLEEYFVKNITTLLTGLIPNSMVLVANKKINDSKSCCSQYPNISNGYFEKNGINMIVKPILGGAEGWLNAGFYEVAVDSFQTGETIYANGINYIDKISESCLALVTKNYQQNKIIFDAFISWLNN